MKTLNEEAMKRIELRIPELAAGAIKQAYVQAQLVGSTLLEVKDDKLVESGVDGSQKVIKKLKPSIRVAAGSKHRLKA